MSGQISPKTGSSVSGLPLSISLPPPADLSRYVTRFFITRFDQPADALLEDFLMHEWGYLRVPIGDGWSNREGHAWTSNEGPMVFGPQRKPFWVRCVGPVIAAGFAIRPAAWFSFWSEPAWKLADRLQTIGGALEERLRWATENVPDHEQTFARLEQVARARILERAIEPDPQAERFETIAHLDPGRSVADIAQELGLARHQLERRIRNHFGHLPKAVLRRSRFLDIAAVMRGLAVPDADALAEMRFYDQSHLNREFRLFTGMTPAQFRAGRTPLFTAGLEVRQQVKLATRGNGADAPWRTAASAAG